MIDLAKTALEMTARMLIEMGIRWAFKMSRHAADVWRRCHEEERCSKEEEDHAERRTPYPR